jgi:hypothetical protein
MSTFVEFSAVLMRSLKMLSLLRGVLAVPAWTTVAWPAEW